ncbi:hypothetical protein CLOM621_08521 [Clostridium sp. M62/1]|nr:hypothetical protein CLOM621_08521 [Clostridium sp. M62/1]
MIESGVETCAVTVPSCLKQRGCLRTNRFLPVDILAFEIVRLGTESVEQTR